jgi:cytochrome c556
LDSMHLPLFALTILLVQTWFSTPFLDQFARREAVPPVEQSVDLQVGGRKVAAYLVTPAAPQRAPAVLLASGREGLTESLRRFAREFAGIGYVALAVDYRGDQAVAGSALLREVAGGPDEFADAGKWVAARPAVDPERIGAIGWNDAFDAVTRLGRTGNVKAYPVRLASQTGMREDAWVAIYEWMGKNVEDAASGAASASPTEPGAQFVRIVDIMRAINSDQGVRGRLARALATPPADDAQWEQARSDAAMVAEGGNLLLAERPPKGSAAGWRMRAADFRSAAETLLGAVERRDFAAAQQSLRELPQTCSACHAEYR